MTRTVNRRGSRTWTRSARGVPRGGVDVPPVRDAGRDAAGRDAGRPDEGVPPTRGTDPERGPLARAGRAADAPAAGVPTAGVAGVVRGGVGRLPGPLGGTGRR